MFKLKTVFLKLFFVSLIQSVFWMHGAESPRSARPKSGKKVRVVAPAQVKCDFPGCTLVGVQTEYPGSLNKEETEDEFSFKNSVGLLLLSKSRRDDDFAKLCRLVEHITEKHVVYALKRDYLIGAFLKETNFNDVFEGVFEAKKAQHEVDLLTERFFILELLSGVMNKENPVVPEWVNTIQLKRSSVDNLKSRILDWAKRSIDSAVQKYQKYQESYQGSLVRHSFCLPRVPSSMCSVVGAPTPRSKSPKSLREVAPLPPIRPGSARRAPAPVPDDEGV